ncbi:hypothetical protein PYCCODRAFT_1202394 [Trametes coccinea BRFM310]|uniref:Uncharacterized protein n=1 Tax=Trametes coccinea (strain BRFM310) TaxID=1353009 RepID=A0A1Y2I7B6_TRAC3|nr:hypothetical protein PYCCODRAFT_1202394 [Trametes coccinea BRFM310]
MRQGHAERLNHMHHLPSGRFRPSNDRTSVATRSRAASRFPTTVLNQPITLAASTSASTSATTQKQNITVDDTAGSADGSLHIAYAPADAWRTGPACGTRCLVAGVDARRVRDGTWHEAAYDSARPRQITATLLFEGSDVYVYGLIPHTNATAPNSVYLSYALDAPSPGGFANASAPFPGDGTVAYDVPLLALTGLAGLPHALHNLTLVVGAAGDTQLSGPAAPSSVLLLDYLVVTYCRKGARPRAHHRPGRARLPFLLPLLRRSSRYSCPSSPLSPSHDDPSALPRATHVRTSGDTGCMYIIAVTTGARTQARDSGDPFRSLLTGWLST